MCTEGISGSICLLNCDISLLPGPSAQHLHLLPFSSVYHATTAKARTPLLRLYEELQCFICAHNGFIMENIVVIGLEHLFSE